MTARVLVVDDIDANVRMLEARLLAEYFDVRCANDGKGAIDICRSETIDIVLLDIMMPGMDGFEVCEVLKADPKTAHIPVVMVTALDQPSDRLRGLKVGADDFLTKPVNDIQLIARVKSLVRLKSMSDELRIRAQAALDLGIDDHLSSATDVSQPANILLMDSRTSSLERTERALRGLGVITTVMRPAEIFNLPKLDTFDLIIVNHLEDGQDPLRLCAHLRTDERTRLLPILLAAEQGDDKMLVRALELGVNDYIARPIDPNELVARSLTQIKRNRYNQRLREGMKNIVDMAVVDPLTGLNNRRYLDSHLKIVFERAVARQRPLSICMIDIDRFKTINDSYGHLAGDAVLQAVSKCLRKAVRGADLLCRYGGEEFILVMPDTDMDVAAVVSERLRQSIANREFELDSLGNSIQVTASFGLAALKPEYASANELLMQADRALYEAKSGGRNRVCLDAA